MTRRIGLGVVAAVLGTVFLSLGCQPAVRQAEGPPPDHVEVYVFWGGDVVPLHGIVTIPGRPTVLQVTRHVAPVATEITSTGEEWVVGIGKQLADVRAGTIWRYELNNEAPTTAPNLRHVEPGDVILWRLQ